MNPKAIAYMWMLTAQMAGAIAIGYAPFVYVVAGLIFAWTLYAVH